MDTQSELTFIDLRLHGGLSATNGHGGALTLMCGDIGDRDSHVVDTARDVGVVIGVRADAEHVKAKQNGGPTLIENELTLELLGGVGVYVDEGDLLEAVAGYGLGQHSDGTLSGFRKRGSSKMLSAEIGWYHTMAKHWQVGGLVGYQLTTMKFDGFPGRKAKANGVDAAVELGYRF